MNNPENNKRLDKILGETIGSEKKSPDFEQWKKEHPKAVQILISRTNDTHVSKCPSKIKEIIMKNPITKFAVAAAFIIVVGLSIKFLDKTVTPAYSIEQTIKTYSDIRYLHVYYYPVTNGDLAKEAWIQRDKNGDVENIRVNLYNHEGKNKHTVMIWRKGITLIWRQHENTLEIDESGDYTPVMIGFAERFSPDYAIEHLYKNQDEGRCQIEIQENSDENRQIRITARYFPGQYFTYPKGQKEINDVLSVNPKTKLVTQIETYIASEGGMELQGVYKDYDSQSFDPSIFDIEKETSDDTIRVVHYNVDEGIEIGIEKSSLTNEEADNVLIQEFFKALIAKDYTRAGLLFGGMPPDEVKAKFDEIKIVNLVSIADRVASGDGLPSYYPCVVEIEENGRISLWQPRVHIGKVTPQNTNRRWINAIF